MRSWRGQKTFLRWEWKIASSDNSATRKWVDEQVSLTEFL